jgi:hypothetical protein
LCAEGRAFGFVVEPATDRIDAYGRLLRYVVRARDGLNVNVRLVAMRCSGAVFLPRAARATGAPSQAWVVARVTTHAVPGHRRNRNAAMMLAGIPVPDHDVLELSRRLRASGFQTPRAT